MLLGFAGGAMIYISFVDLLAESVGAVGFSRQMLLFLGMLGMGILTRDRAHSYGYSPDRNTLSRSEENDLQSRPADCSRNCHAQLP